MSAVLAQPLFDREDQSGDPRGPAWSVKRNARAIVVTLNPWAIPHRDQAWEAAMRAKLGSDAAYERQYGRNWGTPRGDAYYPEFAARVREIQPWTFEGWYVREATQRLAGQPFLRGWDFGYHRPALTLSQYEQSTGTLFVMREVRAENMLVHEFRDLARFLCGQATLEELAEEKKHAALAWIRREMRERFYGWPMPWFQPGEADFVDFGADWELKQGSDKAATVETRTDTMILAQKGIRIRGQKAKWDARDTTMRFLLRENPRTPGYPFLLIDPCCKWLLKAMAGGLTQPTRSQEFGGPKRDRIYEDIHDALTYTAAACWPLRRVVAVQEAERRKVEAEARARAAQDRQTASYARPMPAPPDGQSWARVPQRWSER